MGKGCRALFLPAHGSPPSPAVPQTHPFPLLPRRATALGGPFQQQLVIFLCVGEEGRPDWPCSCHGEEKAGPHLLRGRQNVSPSLQECCPALQVPCVGPSHPGPSLPGSLLRVPLLEQRSSVLGSWSLEVFTSTIFCYSKWPRK